MKAWWMIILIPVVLLGAGEGRGEEIPALVDTDMGLDDVRALLALFASPDLDLHGIVTVEGSAALGRGTDHLIGLMETAGVEGIPVYRGEAAQGIAPPPWRDVADRLGGWTLPPPREIKAAEDSYRDLTRLVKQHPGELHYLALGPLGNLARMEEEEPGVLAKLRAIWIPVQVEQGDRVKAWNLEWDRASAEKVLGTRCPVVLVDLNSAGSVDAEKVLASVDENSGPGKGFRKMIKGPHLQIYDELAAVALIHPELVEICDEAYGWRTEGKGFHLTQEAGGGLKVASFRDPSRALEILVHAWNHPLITHHDHEPERDPRMLLKSFHGHLGPYVVLGYRMGRLALEKTGSRGHFGISARVHSMLAPPPSCLVDGIQLGSGCTLGKRNIEVFETEGPAYAVFHTTDGRKITIRLKDGIPDLVASLVEEKGVESAGETFLKMDGDALFNVEHATK